MRVGAAAALASAAPEGAAGALEAAGLDPEPLLELGVRPRSAANHTSMSSASATSAIW